MKKRFKVVLCVLLLVVVALTAVACGGKSNDYDAPGYGGLGDGAENEDSKGYVADIDRKIVYNVYLRISADDLDALGSDVKKKTAEFGGYIQSSSERTGGSYVTNEYVLRIPTERLDEFLAAIEDGREVTSKTMSQQDITTQYVSAQARMEALESERTALLALMETAATTEDVIAISDRLSDINAELGAIEKQINEYDNLVGFSTVTITASKEFEETDNRSFGQKLRDLIVASFRSVGTVFKGLVVALTAALPYIILIVVVAGIALGIIILVRKKQGKPIFPKCKKRKTKEQTEEEPKEGEK